jgi:polysaccharide deacetylase family protein (PEP-CTERM system associated)
MYGKDLLDGCQLNILTIDLEEWYHPEFVRNKVPKNKVNRLNHSLNKTLSLLSEYDITATFFVVGELLEEYPEITAEIEDKGHEIAFHGYSHLPLWKLNPAVFHDEIKQFKSMLKNDCLGFRAPSFSLNNKTKWALKVLEDEGFIYDSSIFPAKTPLYGVPTARLTPYKPSKDDVVKEEVNGKLWEFPLLVYPIIGQRIPAAGGFYLRLFPAGFIKRAVRNINKMGVPGVLYLHNWELDPETPKLSLGLFRSFVTYYNSKKTVSKLNAILSDFEFTSFRNYLEKTDLL